MPLTLNYQIIIDLTATMLLIAFPIALIFTIGGKISSIFIRSVGGKERIV